MRVLRSGAALLLLLLGRARPPRSRRPAKSSARSPMIRARILPGVTVTIRGAGVPGAPTVTSSVAGTYRFAALPPSIYELEFELQGFTTLKRTAVAVAVGSAVEINVILGVGRATEMITVEGSGPVVNSAAAEVSTTYNREWVENAPTKRFSYFDLVNSSPGVSGNSNVGQSSGAQSMGSSTNENQYQIDGTNISSTPWVSGDAVEEVEVVQLGASAQYGNVQGAVFNIVTRQGGNTLPRRRELLFAEQRADEPQHDGGGRQRPSVQPRHVQRHFGAGGWTVRPRQAVVLRRVPESARLRFAARCRSAVSGEERRAARVLEIQLQHQREPSADARLPRRLLLDPDWCRRRLRRRPRSA